MDPLASLSQICVLFAATSVIILAVELVLLWLLKAFHWQSFVPLTVVGGAALGAGAGAMFAVGLLQPMVAGVVIGLGLALFFRLYVRGSGRLAFLMIAPAFIVICLVVIYPFFFQVKLAFTNLNLYSVNGWLNGGELKFVGFDNFLKLFTNPTAEGTWEAFYTADFWVLFGRTILWTSVNVVFHVGFGLGLAMLLNKDIRFKGWYRMLLVVPWAMPQVVAVLAWRGEFHPQFGVINHLIEAMGLQGINWWSDPVPVFVSCCIVNIWLGIPFMMVVFLGGLGSIPKSYYEAAAIDGASKWTQFREITIPMIQPVVIPSVTLGTIWTFNNINVIYLMTGQDGGVEYADILVSALYKSAFTYSRFSYSAAFAVVIFIVLLSVTASWMRFMRGAEGVA